MGNKVKDCLLQTVKVTSTEKTVDLYVPNFFGESNGDLKLTFCFSGNVYYVHDNGCAINRLKNRVKSIDRLDEIIKTIGSNLSFDGERTVGAFCQVYTFFRYIQMLVFVANADMYFEHLDEDGLRFDSDICLPKDEQCENLDSQELLNLIDNDIYCRLNDDGSYRLSVKMLYSTFSTIASYRVELSETNVRISDFHSGNIEGELFEAFYWDHDDISKYADELRPYCQRFGAEFDGKDVIVSDNIENLCNAMLRFFNLSILLSEFGGLILLPKGR